jgi:hypothetical protein
MEKESDETRIQFWFRVARSRCVQSDCRMVPRLQRVLQKDCDALPCTLLYSKNMKCLPLLIVVVRQTADVIQLAIVEAAQRLSYACVCENLNSDGGELHSWYYRGLKSFCFALVPLVLEPALWLQIRHQYKHSH